MDYLLLSNSNTHIFNHQDSPNYLTLKLFLEMLSNTSIQPVIVVGASLVGLSASLSLCSLNVPTIILEKHSGKSQHPRAIGSPLEPWRSTVVLADDAMEFGQIYLSEGIIGADESLPRAQKPDEWNGQPGTHMPHFWVLKDTLISESHRWDEAVTFVNENSSVPVKFVHLGKSPRLVHQDDFQKSFGVSQCGAALIRPDGYIAWRVDEIPSDAKETLMDVMSKVSFSTN